MRISELARRSGLPIATVKYYLREGMLARGLATGATQAQYDETHVARLRLISALTQVRGLPIARVREVLELIDAPLPDPMETMGRAIGALPPYVETPAQAPRAEAAIAQAGLSFDLRFAAVAQLEAALDALEAAGLPADAATLSRYADAAIAIARAEIAPVGGMDRSEAVEYAVLGTALYEPVLLAFRRLAHQHLLASQD